MAKQHKLGFKKEVDIPTKTIFHDFCFSFSQRFLDGKKLLDIGCWTASFELYLNGTRTVAIDIEEKALKLAKKFVPHTDFVLASATHLPFRKESFDVVTMWNMIEHVPIGSEPIIFSETSKTLKEHGLLFLSTPNGHPIAKCLDPAFFLTNHRHYSPKLIAKLLHQVDFVIKTAITRGGFITAISSNLFYFFKIILNQKMPYIRRLEHLKKKEWEKKGFISLLVVAAKRRITKKEQNNRKIDISVI